MEDDEDCKALSCLSVDCASAIASKFTTGGCFVTKRLFQYEREHRLQHSVIPLYVELLR